MTRVQLLVGTTKGAFILESDADRRDWALNGPLCEGWPIHDLIVELFLVQGLNRTPDIRAMPSRGRLRAPAERDRIEGSAAPCPMCMMPPT